MKIIHDRRSGTRRRLLFAVLGVAALAAFSGCEDPLNARDGDGTSGTPTTGAEPSEADLTTNEGTVGMVVDVRELARRGYTPHMVMLDFAGEFAELSAEIEVDRNTSVATLSRSRADFTETELSTLAAGVDVTVRVFDEAGDQLESESFTAPVDSSNRFFEITTDLPRTLPPVTLDPDTPYLLQAIAPGSPVDGFLYKLRTTQADPLQEFHRPIVYANDFNIEDVTNLPLYSFYFREAGNNLHWLKMRDTPVDPGNELYAGFYVGEYLSTFAGANTPPGPIPIPDIRMRLFQNENGLLRIDPIPLGQTTRLELLTQWSENLVGISDSSSSFYIPVRAIAADVDWEVEVLGTEFSPPILPPARLDFATRTTIENCSEATISQTVGQRESYTRSTTMSTSEGLELFSSAASSTSITTSVEVGGAFKGLGASTSVNATEEWSYTTSVTASTSNTFAATESRTFEVFNERTITVPPNTAIEAYDAVASFDNVKLPFVKVVRVRGVRSGSGVPLTGDQIVTQLVTNQFGGVITNVRTNYVDVTMRGTATVQNYFETQIGTRRIPDGCS